MRRRRGGPTSWGLAPLPTSGQRMTTNSRRKGMTGELEFSKIVEGLLGVRLARNLSQTRDGGHDLGAPGEGAGVGIIDAFLSRYAIEVKRHHAITQADVTRFWNQAQAQASTAGKIPVLAYRADREEWRVVLPFCELNAAFGAWPGDSWTASISVEAFCALVREGAKPLYEDGHIEEPTDDAYADANANANNPISCRYYGGRRFEW